MPVHDVTLRHLGQQPCIIIYLFWVARSLYISFPPPGTYTTHSKEGLGKYWQYVSGQSGRWALILVSLFRCPRFSFRKQSLPWRPWRNHSFRKVTFKHIIVGFQFYKMKQRVSTYTFDTLKWCSKTSRVGMVMLLVFRRNAWILLTHLLILEHLWFRARYIIVQLFGLLVGTYNDV